MPLIQQISTVFIISHFYVFCVKNKGFQPIICLKTLLPTQKTGDNEINGKSRFLFKQGIFLKEKIYVY